MGLKLCSTGNFYKLALQVGFRTVTVEPFVDAKTSLRDRFVAAKDAFQAAFAQPAFATAVA